MSWSVLKHSPGLGSRILSAPAGYVAVPVLRRYCHGSVGLPAAWLFGNVVGRSLAGDLPYRPDVVHAFTADMTGHVALGLGRSVRAPVVFTGFPHPGQYGNGPIDRSAYRRADGVVALTGHDRAVYLGLGVRIPTGLPRSPRRATTLEWERAIELASGWESRGRLPYSRACAVTTRVLTSCTRLHPRSAPASTVPPSPLWAPVTHAFPLAGVDVRDAGEVDTGTMADWIRAADVLVLPSLHEICPIVVLEAWSAAVPVVVSDIPPFGTYSRCRAEASPCRGARTRWPQRSSNFSSTTIVAGR